ncbi:SAM-dependent methyltransferase [uncultured Alsobacter sp.]|uniref:class I SAM-dependent methyltransferase n=1 Tax=uncultured Alsobacter sp. TaxID=1748258 RepID=UPI0025DBA481|nr:SAM-dependent methyltransferase [uncultured Alsobacter sp.]
MTPLHAELARLIAVEGPITVARYMALCLGDPRFGYYMTRDPFGADGDFTTAPEISQMFGELVGLWCADAWQRMGRPGRVLLVELGPGRGTLMADALRAARIVPGFRDALEVHLVETSPVLRERQRATLAEAGVAVSWHAGIEDLPDGPLLVVANEFFDALPVRQIVARGGRWHERLVGLDDAGGLIFGLAPEAFPASAPAGPDGGVLELHELGTRIAATLAGRIAATGGAMLAIDYGYEGPALGDTLQALKRHAFVDVLADPGEADLTVHVDFHALGVAARGAGAAVHGPVGQGAFLRELGIAARAAALSRRAADGGEAQRRALARLTDEGPAGMGSLFKVLAVTQAGLGTPAGFDSVPQAGELSRSPGGESS